MQKNISEFTKSEESTASATDMFEFDQYGPTMDYPLPDAELGAMYPCGVSEIDRREIPDSGLSLSDFTTDWPFNHGRERDRPERIEKWAETAAVVDPRQDDNGGDDLELSKGWNPTAESQRTSNKRTKVLSDCPINQANKEENQ